MRALLLLLPLLLWGTSCLVDQPIEPSDDPTPWRNHHPRIVRKVPEASTLHLQRACRPRFTLPLIEDGNAGDDLEIRWFVNYDQDDSHPLDRWWIDATEATGELRFITNREFVVDLEHWDGVDVLVVEAVVSDGFADPATPPTYRAAAEGKGIALATWTLVVSEASWCNLP